MDNCFPQADSLYYNIASDALPKARNETNSFQKAQSVVTAMVFSALCLEAFINQEYARLPEASHSVGCDDRRPLEKKWLQLPQLLGAKETFDEEGEPFQTFKELVRDRNSRLVHFKYCKEAYSTNDTNRKDRLTYDGLVTDVARAERYVECIEKMIDRLSGMTSGKTRASRYVIHQKRLGEMREFLRGFFAAGTPRENT
ncbi:MAG: hypothetical protein ACYSRP_05510 [Planctomycetota bacterium]|jgi:hypothetical protein